MKLTIAACLCLLAASCSSYEPYEYNRKRPLVIERQTKDITQSIKTYRWEPEDITDKVEAAIKKDEDELLFEPITIDDITHEKREAAVRLYNERLRKHKKISLNELDIPERFKSALRKYGDSKSLEACLSDNKKFARILTDEGKKRILMVSELSKSLFDELRYKEPTSENKKYWVSAAARGKSGKRHIADELFDAEWHGFGTPGIAFLFDKDSKKIYDLTLGDEKKAGFPDSKFTVHWKKTPKVGDNGICIYLLEHQKYSRMRENSLRSFAYVIADLKNKTKSVIRLKPYRCDGFDTIPKGSPEIVLLGEKVALKMDGYSCVFDKQEVNSSAKVAEDEKKDDEKRYLSDDSYKQTIAQKSDMLEVLYDGMHTLATEEIVGILRTHLPVNWEPGDVLGIPDNMKESEYYYGHSYRSESGIDYCKNPGCPGHSAPDDRCGK